MRVDIVTPSKRLVDGMEVDNVVVPSKSGELQILEGHRTLLTLLTTGIVKLERGSDLRQFAISQGTLEVRNGQLVILAETAEEAKEIDLERAKKAQKKSEDELQNVLSEDHFRKYQHKLRRAIIRQSIVR